MDKIYSRKRINCLKFNFQNNIKQSNYDNNKIRKIFKLLIIIIIAIFTAKFIVNAITPIINNECINMAKKIATKVSNEQASLAIAKYKYDDISKITKDNNRKYNNDKCKFNCGKFNNFRHCN